MKHLESNIIILLFKFVYVITYDIEFKYFLSKRKKNQYLIDRHNTIFYPGCVLILIQGLCSYFCSINLLFLSL